MLYLRGENLWRDSRVQDPCYTCTGVLKSVNKIHHSTLNPSQRLRRPKCNKTHTRTRTHIHAHTHAYTHTPHTCMHTHTCIHTSGLTALVAVKNLDSKAIIWNLLRLTTENLSSLPSAAIEKKRRIGISFEILLKQEILYIKQDGMRQMIRSDITVIEVQSDSVHCYRGIICHTTHPLSLDLVYQSTTGDCDTH